MVGLFITVFFVDIHVDVGEALMIAFLTEAEVDLGSYREMNICRNSLKNAISDLNEEERHKI